MRVGFSGFKSHQSSEIPAIGRVLRVGSAVCLSIFCGCRLETATSLDESETEKKVEMAVPTGRTAKTYDGLTVEQWRIRLKTLGPSLPGADAAVPGLAELAADTNVSPVDRRQATMMIGRLGSPGLKALPTLRTLLKEEPVDQYAPAAWAAKAIALLGPAAKEATPDLIVRLESSTALLESRLACLEALARIGGVHVDVIPALLKQLKSPSPQLGPHQQLEIQMGAIDAIFLVGPDAAIAVPRLMDLLDHPHDLIRTKVVQALGAIGLSASPAASAVAEKLVFDDAEEVRRESALALAQFGRDGEQLLRGLTEDEEPIVREFSVSALGKITPQSAEILSVLTGSLDDEVDRVRLVAAKALLSSPQQRDRVISTLTDLLINADQKTRRSAADLCIEMKLNEKEWSLLEVTINSTMDDEYLIRLWTSMQKSRP